MNPLRLLSVPAMLLLALAACGNDPDAGAPPASGAGASDSTISRTNVGARAGGAGEESIVISELPAWGAGAADPVEPGARKGGRGKQRGGARGGTGEAAMVDVIPADLHPGDGTARMAARLAELATRGDAERDIALNNERVAMFETRLAQAVRAGEPTLQLRFSLATEKNNAGRPDEAAAELTAMLAELDARQATVKPETRLMLMQALAVAWLRVGELGNCVKHHGAQSCILPISEAGRHADPAASRQAMELLAGILRSKPDDYAARWLLNVAAMTVGDWPDRVPEALLVPPSVFKSEQDVGRFNDVAVACGVGNRGLAGGVCEEDFDGDGLLDLVTSDWAIEQPLHFFRNEGNGKFTDRSAEAGVPGITGGLNMLHADVDNDGDADIFIPRGGWKAEAGARHPPSLLQNDGRGVFRDITEEAGLLCFLASQTAAFADCDGDGWLDLFVGTESVRKQRTLCRLFHNNRDGTFTDVAAEVGLDLLAYVKGCGWGDYDDDGDPDLAISRMDGSPLLFRNDGDRFTDVTDTAGITGPEQSFPCWFFDYDNDGQLDLFFSGYHAGQTDEVCRDYLGLPHDGKTPRLYRNRGDGTFEDTTAAAGLMHVLPAMGANFGDLDNDGWPDFYLSTGEPDLKGIYPNRLFRNDGGTRFVDVTTSAGMGHLQKGHGIAFGDLDNDGDQDVYAVMGGAFSGDGFQRTLFENPGHGNRWVTLLLQGTQANRGAIGARLRVTVRRPDGSARDIHTTVGTGGSFGSGSLQAEIGLGDATSVEAVEVRWPGSGNTQVFTNLPMDRSWRIVEGNAAPVGLERHAFKLGGG